MYLELTDKTDRRIRWTNAEGAHHPMDRIGGPFRIHHILGSREEEYRGARWYMFALVGCWFPTYFAVLGESLENALDRLLDETDCFVVDPDNLEDYDLEDIYWSDSGKPCDLDNLSIFPETTWKAHWIESVRGI